MLHPIFSTVLGHPELIANHLAGYAALNKEEASQASRGTVTRLVSGALALLSALLALSLSGMAVMLGVLHGSFNWVLVIVPGVAILMAVVCGLIARRPTQTHAFADLRTQFKADVHAFNSVREHHHGDQ